jgi:DNA-binding MarR family transcriptional regulator
MPPLFWYKKKNTKMRGFMETEWMGKYRVLVEQLIRLMNTYARRYTSVNKLEETTFWISSAQIQTIEYVMESKGRKMSEIAARMGITRSTFSNNVKKLEKQGCLKKNSFKGNQKDIHIVVTPKGENLYRLYVNHVYRLCFKKMFDLADLIPAKHIKTFGKILDSFTEAFMNNGELPQSASGDDIPPLRQGR